MRIGAGIALIVAGAIIAFAVRDTSDTLNLTALGIIIMLGGAAGIWLSYRLANRRRRSDTTVIDPEVEKQYRTAAAAAGRRRADRRHAHPSARDDNGLQQGFKAG